MKDGSAKEPRPFPSFEEFKGWVQKQDFGPGKPSLEWEKKAYPAIYTYFWDYYFELAKTVLDWIKETKATLDAILEG
ncbi:MAG: hypothetical protein QXQ64_02415 [Candidatus Bathyarchaeia archaeon]|uniref:hypothetical protein n=1 Tax=Candidatus Hadarchaeum sp. TaxID=2883567 RepID=UPI00316F3B2E